MLVNLFAGIGITLLVLLGLVLLVLVAVLLLNIGVNVRYQDGAPTVIIRLGAIRFDLLKLLNRPKKKKQPKIIPFDGTTAFGKAKTSAKKKKAAKRKTKRADKAVTETAKKQKPSLLETVTYFKDMTVQVAYVFAKYAKVHVKCLYVLVASEDPSDTAVLFGHINTVVGTALHALDRFYMVTTDKENVGVYVDFTKDRGEFTAEAELSIYGWQALVCMMQALKLYAGRPKKQ